MIISVSTNNIKSIMYSVNCKIYVLYILTQLKYFYFSRYWISWRRRPELVQVCHLVNMTDISNNKVVLTINKCFLIVQAFMSQSFSASYAIDTECGGETLHATVPGSRCRWRERDTECYSLSREVTFPEDLPSIPG